MKARFAAAVLILAAGSASADLNAYRTTINFSQAVKLPDGKILPAGLYDVEIEYKGFGNTAQFHFFPVKVQTPLGTAPAEARGFPSEVPQGNTARYPPKYFDWKTAGFSGAPGKSSPAGQSVKISIDSSNSAAGFFAVLPAAPKGK